MNYKKLYDSIIEKAKGDDRSKGKIYYESHHIIPRCLGGDNSQDNLVLLTAREHFICHKLLVEIYPESEGVKYALWMMCIMKDSHERTYQVTSKDYARARKLSSMLTIKNQSIPILRILGNEIVKFESTAEAYNITGVSKKKIQDCLSGRRKSYKGIWIKEDDFNNIVL